MLLRQIIEHVLGPDVLTVYAERASDSAEGRGSGNYGVPDALFPNGEWGSLPDGEGFPEALKSRLEESRGRSIFLLPPPLSASRIKSDSYHAAYPRMNLEEAAMLAAIETLPEGTALFALLPSHFFARANSASRGIIFAKSKPLLVVTPENLNRRGVFQAVHPAFEMMGVLLRAGSSKGVTRFLRFPNDLEEDDRTAEILTDLKDLLGRGGGETKWGYVYRGSLSPESMLVHELYNPARIAAAQSVSSYGDSQELGALADVYMGFVDPTRHADILKDPSDGGVPVLRGASLPAGGAVDRDSVRFSVEPGKGRELQAGDLLLPAIQRGAPLRVVLVEEEDLPLTCDRTVIVVRPDISATTREERELLFAYLSSGLAWQLLEPTVSTIGSAHASADLKRETARIPIRISGAALSKLWVPTLDSGLRGALQEINSAIAGFKEWQQNLTQVRSELFNMAQFGQLRGDLLLAGQTARLRYRAAKLMDDLAHRIHVLFPHPIAYRWRTVEAAKPDLEGYISVLECAEVVVLYSACVVATMARGAGIDCGALREMAKRLSQRGSGTNFGDWMAILREANASKRFRKQDDSIPFAEVVACVPASGEVDQALQRLKKKRDDQAHNRGPKGARAVAEKFEECKSDLVTLLGAMEFLSEYPLRLVESVHFDTIRKTTRYCYRDLVGDHPLVPTLQETRETLDHALEAGSLYLRDRDGELHLLRPIMTRHECPECATWSTFYLDYFDAKAGGLTLKSMEHGHTMRADDTVDLFREIGWLLSS